MRQQHHQISPHPSQTYILVNFNFAAKSIGRFEVVVYPHGRATQRKPNALLQRVQRQGSVGNRKGTLMIKRTTAKCTSHTLFKAIDGAQVRILLNLLCRVSCLFRLVKTERDGVQGKNTIQTDFRSLKTTTHLVHDHEAQRPHCACQPVVRQLPRRDVRLFFARQVAQHAPGKTEGISRTKIEPVIILETVPKKLYHLYVSSQNPPKCWRRLFLQPLADKCFRRLQLANQPVAINDAVPELQPFEDRHRLMAHANSQQALSQFALGIQKRSAG